MPTLKINRFTEVAFTEEEEKAASTFSEAQKLFLCNLRTQAALQSLELVFDPTAAHQFLGDKAFLQGQLALLDTLIGDAP